MFCAAIPATLAIGAKAQSNQRRQGQQVEQRGDEAAPPKISAGAITALAVAGLVTASIVYHSQQGG